MKLVVTGAEDRHNVGFKNWRAAFYFVARDGDDRRNAMEVLDDYFVWALARGAQEGMAPFTVNVHQRENVNLVTEGLNYPRYVLQQPEVDLALPVFSVNPPNYWKNVVMVDFQVVDENTVDLVFEGHTLVYRARFEAQGVRGRNLAAAGAPANWVLSLIHI